MSSKAQLQKSRACDGCRRRKTRCDGPQMKDNVCSNCLQTHKSCTYLEASTPRGPPKAYVTGLEDRLEQLEQLLKQVRPDVDYTAELGPPIPRGAWKDDAAPVASTSRLEAPESPPNPSLRLSTHLALNSRPRRDRADSDSSSDGFSTSDSEQLVEGLAGGLRRLTLRRTKSRTADAEDRDIINTRFHGKSSVVTLIDATRRYKELHVSDSAGNGSEHASASLPPPVPGVHAPFKRPEFWLPQSWELQWEGFEVDVEKLLASVLDEFPPTSLAAALIDLYFIHVNSQLPLLHRPTFERQFREKLHHRNIWFTCVCLGIFAAASRWSNDPLVLPRNCNRTDSGGLDWKCAGWHYHNVAMGIHRIRQSLLYPACLEEIQTFSLLALFLRGTVNHPAAWMFISLGLRKAQDVGAHRKKVYGDTPSLDAELWKRAFWCLVAFDRFGSAILGRPCALDEEDFDLDPLLELNDDLWESDRPTQQPPDVPCRITCFNLWLRLSQIVTFTVRTIYAVHNPRALLGRIAKVRTDEIIAQLRLALQGWLRSVPEYLRWSDRIEDDELSNQSATLYTTYYLAEMLMYRAFIPPIAAPSSPAPQLPHISASFPALAFCINAARSSARIVEVQMARGWTNVPTLVAVSQLSAGILTLGVWDAKAKQQQDSEDVKPPLAHTIAPLMDDIGIFLGALEWAESRWENVTASLRVLKGALPKEETLNLPEQRSPPDPLPAHLHSFDETQNDEPEHWSLPLHSSSVRTRPMAAQDSRSDRPASFEVGLRPPPAASNEHGHRRASIFLIRRVLLTYATRREPGWDVVHPTYADDPDYPRAHFDHPHHSYSI
ncbi:fungal-specific transcription factor domain-containing protein [Mycena rosella]|uniref:Fungal-specific transcription factor domain-containing protein n=1 Tax=Mycena rosella TaxID=1033263 RepID=A0AAD7E238_MYCRO|nr:fungal-specific transcription factor domain-containing protein [Mycena rosella]